MDVYQLKITLQYSEPPIWRRIQVAADTQLGKLHHILQAAMGWTDSHLHQFVIGDMSYGVPDPDDIDEIKSERSVPLNLVAQAGDTLIYEYDFGDGWVHALKIEKALPAGPGTRYPVCLAGARACPPEDCGGPPGYQNLVEVLNNTSHEEYKETREWIGPEFDSEAFDLDDINRALKKIK